MGVIVNISLVRLGGQFRERSGLSFLKVMRTFQSKAYHVFNLKSFFTKLSDLGDQLLKLLPLKSATKPMKAFAPKAFQALKNLIKKPLALKPSRFDFVPSSHRLLVRANDGLRHWSKLVLVQSCKQSQLLNFEVHRGHQSTE